MSGASAPATEKPDEGDTQPSGLFRETLGGVAA